MDRQLQSAAIFASGLAVGAVLIRALAPKRSDDPDARRETAKLRGAPELMRTCYQNPRHWFQNKVLPGTERFIAELRVRDDKGNFRQVLVLLKSGEGYATVVALNRVNGEPNYNWVPSQRDYEATALAASQVAAAFLRLGIFPSMELLGNNSHGFDKGMMVLGNETEPFNPHFHIIGRGDPEHCYIGGVPLRGRPPGDVMVPRQRAERFESGEAAVVADGIARSLEAVELHPDITFVQRRPLAQL